ncbi:hypothetical protein phiAS5_ORF0246 [Aeromonas phage phiAS5]|uniref:Uncharacterized protein n=1 Tax=Aeromonas phage phiAS5 TaxID=879630 RepID=E1A200_9CAUD|nr:hypothetical protein phiAS5_ORF0246 [Aeromonas phage phiAS5]ADM80089.1 hypothetical protein phiAS5_ORF0246 [Aeromonas phage phiAS5]BES53147.1 hypothetical protein [Aeromonas phage phiWae14]
MTNDFNLEFMKLTERLAESLYLMNRARLDVASYAEFSEYYDQAFTDFDGIAKLLRTISGIELETSTMKAYLRGLSCQLQHIVERKQIADLGRQFVYPIDPYEESFKLYRELVLSGGRTVLVKFFSKSS